ncbi:MAG: hypothetical protein ACYTFI_15770 [Planctomycetota bacterium]
MIRSACRRAAASLALAVLWILPAVAEEGDGAKKDDLPADAAKAKVEGVVLKPHRPEKEELTKGVTPVPVILGDTKGGGRKTVIAPSVGAAARGVREATIAGRQQVDTTFELREQRYTGWAESELLSEPDALPTGTVVLTELETSLELACPREVKAGEPIVLQVKSTGNLDIDWDVSVMYRDGSPYEKTRLSAGDKVGGEKRVQKVSFTTWPADRGTLLGVRVKRPERSEDSAIFWVTVR